MQKYAENMLIESSGSWYSIGSVVVGTGKIILVADRLAGSNTSAKLLEVSKEELRKGKENLNS